MTVTMKETIYRSQDSEAAIGTKVRRVVATAAKFAEMENTAFWEERAGDCVAVYEGPNEPTAADVIPCAEIGRHAEAWASELFDWCADMPDAAGIGEPSLIDAETDDYTEFAHREVTIRIGDLMFCGGIRLEAFDGNGNKISGIAFVPSNRQMDAEIAAIKRKEPHPRDARGNRKSSPRQRRRVR